MDFEQPNYAAIYKKRLERLQAIRNKEVNLDALGSYYRENIAQFITDWGVTFDPRNVERKLPAIVPFILFDKQREWVEQFIECWKNQEPFLTAKTRDMGLSWLSIATACSICLFNRGVIAGFGSRKEEYVDKIGAPKSLFFKARFFLDNLPKEFKGTFNSKKHAPHMRVNFPDSGSIITGESGDGIGRGDRSSFYFVDESAFLERPQLTEASLSQTTNCRVDISTPNGSDNPFAQKFLSGKYKTFLFHWRDDPRKNQAWYDKQIEILDPVTVAQEIDISFVASKENIVIPNHWIESAIDAHKRLDITPTGIKQGAFDVADRGKDLNAFSARYGLLLTHLEKWSGKEETDDIFESVEKCFLLSDQLELEQFVYDADGLGAATRGDSRVINEKRKERSQHEINVKPFRGSESVIDPNKEMIKGRKNADFFYNCKAQGWWYLRQLFQNTHRAIMGREHDDTMLIAISSELPHLAMLKQELTQPTYSLRDGKVLIDKQPESAKSPNLADSVMMNYAPKKRPKRSFFD